MIAINPLSHSICDHRSHDQSQHHQHSRSQGSHTSTAPPHPVTITIKICCLSCVYYSSCRPICQFGTTLCKPKRPHKKSARLCGIATAHLAWLLSAKNQLHTHMHITHFGCSFAVGNGIQTPVPGMTVDEAIRQSRENTAHIERKWGITVQRPYTCGQVIAEQLGWTHSRCAENGVSNEWLSRNLVQYPLQSDSFVLIGITSGNRREALTTAQHIYTRPHNAPEWQSLVAINPWSQGKNQELRECWHTWKMIHHSERRQYKDQRFDPWQSETKGTRKFEVSIERDSQCRVVLQILFMQSWLKANHTPYLMFNALNNGFDQPLTRECQVLLQSVDQRHYFDLAQTHGAQIDWTRRKGLNVSELDAHPCVRGQRIWGNLLLDHVKSHKLAH